MAYQRASVKKILSWTALISVTLTQAAYAQIITPDATNQATGTANTNTMTGAGTWGSQSDYWREHYAQQPYATNVNDYANYEPAYQYGVSLFRMNYGRDYDQLDQSQISTGWEQARGKSTLNWSDAQQAVRDAYTHMSQNHDATGNAATSYESVPVQQPAAPVPTPTPTPAPNAEPVTAAPTPTANP